MSSAVLEIGAAGVVCRDTLAFTTGVPKGVRKPLPETPFGVPHLGHREAMARYRMDEAMVYLSPAPGELIAIDATAGERERSTWETLMTTSASRLSVSLPLVTFNLAHRSSMSSSARLRRRSQASTGTKSSRTSTPAAS